MPMLPPKEVSLNARGHWTSRHQASRTYGGAVFYCCVDVRNRLERLPWRPGYLPFTKAKLDLTFVFKDRRKRDEDNLRARFKPGQDGLVQANLVPDDSPEHLVMGKVTIEVDKERAPLTIIELTEVK